jgi:hypothetical protein
MEYNMDKLLEQRRQGYLAYFKDGVADGLMYGERDETKTFSTYYKQGYEFGTELWNKQGEIKYKIWETKNGRKI